MRVEVHQLGTSEAASRLTDGASQVESRLAALKRHYAQVMASYAAQAASGYGWTHYPSTIQADDDSAYTDAPQGHRLEVGFHGIDSLGHHVSQGPRPHFGPAADRAGAQFWVAVDAFMDTL